MAGRLAHGGGMVNAGKRGHSSGFNPLRLGPAALRIAAVLALMMCLTSSAEARTLYVSPTGPLRSVALALQQAAPGDVIQIAAGNYPEPFTSSQPVTLVSGGGTVVLGRAGNRPPSPNAGADQVVRGYTGSLSGSAPDDGQPNPPGRVSVQWLPVSGPGTVAFDSPYTPATRVTVSAYGTYVFRLAASDGALAAVNDVQVTFRSGPDTGENDPPVVNIVSPPTVVLPANASLAATVTDDGRPNPPGRVTLTWSKVSGPGRVTFSPPNTENTVASFSIKGDYVVRLTANDGAALGSAEVPVTVTDRPPLNEPPRPNAGPDQRITVGSTLTLVGAAPDDGKPIPPGRVTTTWSRVSGPGTVTFGNPSALTTTATFSAVGTYVVALTANDGALQREDTAKITVVSEPNSAPRVNAGPNTSIDMPDAAFLNGTATDDGRPNPPGRLTVTWSKVSGPGGVLFGNASQPNTTATFSAPGSYVLRLFATDGDRSDSDTMTVTVREARDYLVTYENTQRRCYDFGYELRVRNTHPRRSISYVIIVRYSTRFSGEYEETVRGTLSPGESAPFSCSDRIGGPGGRGYVSHRISGANFRTPDIGGRVFAKT